jgi:PAS domain S-box-containing protein
VPKSISASTLETYHANHPVPTVLVERTNLKIVDGNKSACRFFGLTKKKLQSHQLSDFCQSSKLKINQNKSGLSKNLGHYSFQVGNGMKEAQLVSYPLSNKSKYVVLELHRVKHDHEGITKALFKDSKNSIILIGLDFKILAFNKVAKNIIKELFRAQLQAGTDFLQFVEPNQVGLFKRYFNAALAGEEITRDLKTPYRDGNRWFHFSFSPFLDVAGKIIGVVYTAVDIHDKKIAEEETDKKESLLLKISKNLPNAVLFQFLLNKDGVTSFPFISAGSTELFGVMPEEFKRDSSIGFSMVHPDDMAYIMEQMNRSKQLMTEYKVKHRIIVSGKVKWVKTRSTPERFSDGSILWHGVILDVTTTKLVAEKLKTVESNLKAIVENTDTGYVLYDKELKVASFNKLAQMFAETYLDKTIVSGSNGLDYFGAERQPTIEGYLKQAMQGETSSYTVFFGTPENPFWLFGRIFAAREEMGEVYGAILALTDITLIKESQAKLDRSQKLYESLIKSQTCFLVRTDMQGHYSFVNKRFLDHFGFTENEVLGKHSFETIHPEDWGICERAVMDCMIKPGKVVRAIFRKPNKGGEFFWTEWEFVTIQNEAGGLTDIQCFGYDITIRLEAENRLKEMANRLSVATQSAELGIWEVNPNTDKSCWDKRMYEIFGISETTEITFDAFIRWVHVDDQNMVRGVAADFFKNQVNFVYRIIRQNDKAIRYVQAFGLPQPSSESLVGVTLDVTERVEMERKLIETGNRLELATRSAKIGVWEWDLNTNSIRWDPLIYELYGMEDQGDLSFGKFEASIHPDDKKMIEEQTALVIQQRMPVDSSFRIIRQTDLSIRHIKSYGVFDPIKNRYTGINLDVTNLIEKEKAIEKAKSQIGQLQLNALRAAMNPHFIFNALNSIQYFITQSQRENAIDFLSKFSKLIRGILDSTSGKKATIASELELIQFYVEIEQVRFEHKFDFKLTVDPIIEIETIELPALLIQPYVENAILHGLYTKEGRGLLEIDVVEHQAFYKITIADNGIGREAAAVLRKANFPEHKSSGLRLSQQRVELINESNPITVAIYDLTENEKPAGTKVEITIGKELDAENGR